MDRFMIVIAAIAAIVVIAPLVAILVVSVASLHEESARSLSGAAPNLAARLARRVVGFRGDLRSAPAPRPRRRSGHEVRFAYASNTLPDPGRQPARRQSQPRPIRFEQRQPAGV